MKGENLIFSMDMMSAVGPTSPGASSAASIECPKWCNVCSHPGLTSISIHPLAVYDQTIHTELGHVNGVTLEVHPAACKLTIASLTFLSLRPRWICQPGLAVVSILFENDLLLLVLA